MVAEAIRTTLGPRGMDKLIVDSNGKSTISNDGATIVKLLDIVHPAARTLVDIAKSQDAEVVLCYCVADHKVFFRCIQCSKRFNTNTLHVYEE